MRQTALAVLATIALALAQSAAAEHDPGPVPMHGFKERGFTAHGFVGHGLRFHHEGPPRDFIFFQHGFDSPGVRRYHSGRARFFQPRPPGYHRPSWVDQAYNFGFLRHHRDVPFLHGGVILDNSIHIHHGDCRH